MRCGRKETKWEGIGGEPGPGGVRGAPLRGAGESLMVEEAEAEADGALGSEEEAEAAASEERIPTL